MTKHVLDLKDLTPGKVRISGDLAPGDLEFGDDSLKQTGPLSYSLTAERAGSEIRIAGSVRCQLEISCSRCLDPVVTVVDRPVDLFFRQRDTIVLDEDQEIELGDSDMNIGYFSGTELDIGDILREQVLLAVPMKVLCDTECKGLCPTCGANRNTLPCSCAIESLHPAMEVLSELKRRMEQRSS